MSDTTTKEFTPLGDILTGMIRGDVPLRFALDTWKSYHELSYVDVSRMIRYADGAVSSWIHARKNGKDLPMVAARVAELIGYEERPTP